MSRLSWIEKKKQPAFEIFLIEFNFNAFQITWKLWVIIFGSVLFLSKKNNQTEIFKKKKPKPGQTDRFRFGSVFYGKNRFKPVWLGFSWFWLGFLGFSGLARFFSGFFSVSVRFGFFGFLLIKPKPNRNGRFFQNFNQFNLVFFRFVFSIIIFQFSRFNQLFGLFTHPY